MRVPSQRSLAAAAAGLPWGELAPALLCVATGFWLVGEARRGVRAVAAERGPKSLLSAASAPPLPPAPPLVSVLVPARNEARRIGPCIASLLRLDYPRLEVLVIDDGSSDGTAGVVRGVAGGDPRLRVLEAPPLPVGWAGKNHALWYGQREARGAWLLFTDADTVHEPASLRAALGWAEAEGVGLVSLSGRQEAHSLAERLVQPFVFEFLARRFPLAAVNDPRDPRAAANGQYLLVSRAAYDAVGGHAAVGGEILEDVALAARVKAAGLGIRFLAAPDLLRVRMYDGPGALVEGWTKNLADLAGGPVLTALEGLRLLARGLLPPAALLAGIVAAATDQARLAVGPCLLAVLGGAALLAEAASLAHLGGGSRGAWLAPAGAAATGGLFLWSAYRRAAGRGVSWRGRRYAAGASGRRIG